MLFPKTIFKGKINNFCANIDKMREATLKSHVKMIGKLVLGQFSHSDNF